MALITELEQTQKHDHHLAMFSDDMISCAQDADILKADDESVDVGVKISEKDDSEQLSE